MSVISRQELLDLKALMVSEKIVFGGCLIHEDVIQKRHEYELSLLNRAEKAEAELISMKDMHYQEYKFGFKEGMKRKILMMPDEYHKNLKDILNNKEVVS